MKEEKSFLIPYDEDFTLYYEDHPKNAMDHWHKHYELAYVISGSVSVIVGHRRHLVKEGEILFIGAYETHRIEKHKKAMLLLIQFKPHIVDPVFRPFFDIKYLIPMMNPSKVVRLSSKEQEFLKWMFDDIQFNFDHISPASKMAIRGSIIRLIGFMINDRRLIIPNITDHQSVQVGKILTVLNHLEDHYMEPIDEQTAASLAGYNYAYFSDLFKKIMGHTFSEHLNLIRLRAARTLLADSQKGIAMISEEIGYQNLSYFNRMFKKHLLMTPREYRQSLYQVQPQAPFVNERKSS